MRNFVQALTLLIWTVWPMTALAAGLALESELGNISLLAWLQVTTLSLVSGLGTFLNWLRDGLEQADAEEDPVKAAKMRAKLFSYISVKFGSHMLSSWLAGLLAFFTALATDLKPFPMVLAVATAALMGSLYISKLVEKAGGKKKDHE